MYTGKIAVVFAEDYTLMDRIIWNLYHKDVWRLIDTEWIDGKVEYCGTVAAYTVTDEGWLVWVSGYKQPVTGECLPDQVEPMTKEEIDILTGGADDGS